MLLTLSIVTLAAVQGYTGTLVDERTVDATVGSDIQVTFEILKTSLKHFRYSMKYTRVALHCHYRSKSTAETTDSGDTLLTWVILDDSDEVLKWNEQSLRGTEVSDALDAYSKLGFRSGRRFHLYFETCRPRWRKRR